MLHLENRFVWCCNLDIWKADQKYLVRFQIWCRRRTKISGTCRKKIEVLPRGKKERYSLHMIFRRKTSWIRHILRRNCLLKHIIEGKIERRPQATERRRRSCMQLVDELNEKRWYWKLKEETLAQAVWRTGFGGDYGLVVKQATEWMNE